VLRVLAVFVPNATLIFPLLIILIIINFAKRRTVHCSSGRSYVKAGEALRGKGQKIQCGAEFFDLEIVYFVGF